MTITIEIGERSFAVPPFMLAELEAAAPHIDRMNDLRTEFAAIKDAGGQPTMTQAFQMTRELVEILAIGIANVDPEMTANEISRSVNWTFMGSLQLGVDALLRSSGLDPAGEAKAPKAKAKGAARAKA